MKSFTTTTLFLAVSAAVASAQLQQDPNTGLYICPIADGVYCGGTSLQTNIIIRCTNGVGQPGNCNDNLAGEPPVGVNPTTCYATGDGKAACSKNCVVYGSSGNLNGTFPLPIPACPYVPSSSSSSSSPTSSSVSSTVVTSVVTKGTVVSTVVTTICPTSSAAPPPPPPVTTTKSGPSPPYTIRNGTHTSSTPPPPPPPHSTVSTIAPPPSPPPPHSTVTIIAPPPSPPPPHSTVTLAPPPPSTCPPPVTVYVHVTGGQTTYVTSTPPPSGTAIPVGPSTTAAPAPVAQFTGAAVALSRPILAVAGAGAFIAYLL